MLSDVFMKNPEDIISETNEFYVQALLVAEVVKRILLKRAKLRLSTKPVIVLKPITEFVKKMRVVGLEKFNEKTFISTVNFYRNQKDEEANKAVGTLVVYIPESYVSTLIRQLGYPDVDEDDKDLIEDAVGTFCNLIAGSFKTGLTQLDYKELVMSHFSSYENEVIDGVEFDETQRHLYEISFEINGVKSIVVDLTMGPIYRYLF